ncbi:hypothetical protein GCM10018954_065700 [Kutzneria kofuensis]
MKLAIGPDVSQELEPHVLDRDRRVERGNAEDQTGRLPGRPTQPSATARTVPSALTASATVIDGVASDEFENDADKSEYEAMRVISAKRKQLWVFGVLELTNQACELVEQGMPALRRCVA